MYNFYSTPSHGYLAVPTADYEASGYKASRFSYSGFKTDMIYLEEDCDARGFMDAANVSIDNIQEVVLDYEPDSNLLKPLSGEGFELRIGTGY
jgi:hypothetical protein